MSEWISVEERLPKRGEYVLVCNKRNLFQVVAKWDGIKWKAGWNLGEVRSAAIGCRCRNRPV